MRLEQGGIEVARTVRHRRSASGDGEGGEKGEEAGHWEHRVRSSFGKGAARMRERAAAIADASAAEYRKFAADAEAKGFYRLAGEQHGAANDAERIAASIRALPLEDDKPS